MPPIIELNNISKSYRLGNIGSTSLREDLSRFLKKESKTNKNKEFWALKDISFSVDQGEAIGIIGHNGAGKSTLLKILSRITEPSEGEALLRGRVASLLEVGTGFHPELTGRENIYLNGTTLGMKKVEIDHHLDSIIDFSGCEQFIDTPIKRYSSGMIVRLGFSVASHLKSEILIVDEVLAVGDWNFQKKCIAKMQEIATQEGRTIFFVTHQMQLIENLCSYSILLDHGKVQHHGSVSKGIELYLSKKIYQTNSLSERSDIQTTDTISLKWVKLLNSHSKETDMICCGDSFKIALQLTINKNTNLFDPLIIFNVLTEKEQPVFTQHNQLMGIHYKSLNDNDLISCEFSEVPIPNGNYYINITIFDSDTLLYKLENAVNFSVSGGNYLGNGEIPHSQFGLCVVKAKWSLNEQ